MNCNNFEAIISDVAREQMLEASVRQHALSHMEECTDCAARLENERALTEGLKALAAGFEQMEAPAHVEANLLAKFRERKAAENSTAVVVPMPERVSRWQRWYPQAAAAAVLLMFAIGGAIALRTRQQAPLSQSGAAVAASKSSETKSQAPTDSATPMQVNGDEQNTTAAVANNAKDGERPQKLSKNEVAALWNTTTARRGNGNTVNVSRSGVSKSMMTSTSGEIATDFMPVSYGDNLNEIDQGRIVRVEMPRSALAQFGLPINMDRANERIKADVLIGDDGMARAIRFVR